MASSKGANKGSEKAKNGAIAGRLAYLRSEQFVTEGFASNVPVPSLSECRKMARNNAALIASQRPTPSIGQGH